MNEFQNEWMNESEYEWKVFVREVREEKFGLQ
jgi:hypothetical protein